MKGGVNTDIPSSSVLFCVCVVFVVVSHESSIRATLEELARAPEANGL